jgi:hypothetical protein
MACNGIISPQVPATSLLKADLLVFWLKSNYVHAPYVKHRIYISWIQVRIAQIEGIDQHLAEPVMQYRDIPIHPAHP